MTAIDLTPGASIPPFAASAQTSSSLKQATDQRPPKSAAGSSISPAHTLAINHPRQGPITPSLTDATREGQQRRSESRNVPHTSRGRAGLYRLTPLIS